MNTSSHPLTSRVETISLSPEPIALRPLQHLDAPVDRPHVPEQGGERVTAFHLLREDWSGILPVGSQFVFVCIRHQFASPWVDDRENVNDRCTPVREEFDEAYDASSRKRDLESAGVVENLAVAIEDVEIPF